MSAGSIFKSLQRSSPVRGGRWRLVPLLLQCNPTGHAQQGLPGKLTLPFPPITAASATGSGSPWTPAGGQRKTSGDLNWRREKPCHENCTTFFPRVAANPSTAIVPGQSLAMWSPFWHWSTGNAPHHGWPTSSPMLCQQETQNRATDTMAGSQ